MARTNGRAKNGRSHRTNGRSHGGGGGAAGNGFLDLPVREVMQTDLVTVAASTPLSEVERALAEAGVGGVPVIDGAGRVVGVLSLRDLVDRYTEDPEARPNPSGFYRIEADDADEDDLEAFEIAVEGEETAGDVMSAQVFWVPPSATLREVAREMVQHGVHRLIVHDPEVGQTVGIVSTMDLLRAMAGAAPDAPRA